MSVTYDEKWDAEFGVQADRPEIEWIGIDTTPSGYVATSSGVFVPEYFAKSAPIGLDLFAGCGGFSLGMEMAGIDVVAALEWDVHAFTTYVTNLGSALGGAVAYSGGKREELQRVIAKAQKKRTGTIVTDIVIGDPMWWGWNRRPEMFPKGVDGCRAFFLGDIRECSGQMMLDLARVDHFDVVFGGPPCQGLSTSNSKACIEDPRNAMLWEFLRMVEELQPAAFVIENVPPLLTAGGGGLFRALRKRAIDMGYTVVAEVINAVNYGVPQNRKRAIVMGATDGRVIQFPMPTTWAIGMEPGGKAWDFTQGDDDPNDVEFDEETQRWKVVAQAASAEGDDALTEQASLFAELRPATSEDWKDFAEGRID